MNISFLLGLLLFHCAVENESVITYTPMECEWDLEYVNGLDGVMSVSKSNQWFAGAQSYHNNGAEDRQWKYRYCRPTGDTAPFSGTTPLAITDWDVAWTRTCGGYSAISGADSFHDNGREDRRWTFTCADLNTAYTLKDCAYSAELNGWDGPLDYACPSDGVIRSIWSTHDNGREDRLWKFECCRVAAATTPPTTYPTTYPTADPTADPTIDPAADKLCYCIPRYVYRDSVPGDAYVPGVGSCVCGKANGFKMQRIRVRYLGDQTVTQITQMTLWYKTDFMEESIECGQTDAHPAQEISCDIRDWLTGEGAPQSVFDHEIGINLLFDDGTALECPLRSEPNPDKLFVAEPRR